MRGVVEFLSLPRVVLPAFVKATIPGTNTYSRVNVGLIPGPRLTWNAEGAGSYGIRGLSSSSKLSRWRGPALKLGAHMDPPASNLIADCLYLNLELPSVTQL